MGLMKPKKMETRVIFSFKCDQNRGFYQAMPLERKVMVKNTTVLDRSRFWSRAWFWEYTPTLVGNLGVPSPQPREKNAIISSA